MSPEVLTSQQGRVRLSNLHCLQPAVGLHRPVNEAIGHGLQPTLQVHVHYCWVEDTSNTSARQ